MSECSHLGHGAASNPAHPCFSHARDTAKSNQGQPARWMHLQTHIRLFFNARAQLPYGIIDVCKYISRAVHQMALHRQRLLAAASTGDEAECRLMRAVWQVRAQMPLPHKHVCALELARHHSPQPAGGCCTATSGWHLPATHG